MTSNTSPEDARPFLTIGEVAELFGVTSARIYQLVTAGELPAVKVAGRIRVPRAAWDEWLDAKSREALASVRTPNQLSHAVVRLRAVVR